MRVRAFTQRHRGRSTVRRIPLFPFLAVLMCIMGALILLLVILSRQARLQAAQTAAKELTQRQSDQQRQRERVQWRIEQLKNAREKTEEQLTQTRLQLGHLEDHARRLRNNLAQLQKTAAALDQLGTDDHQQRHALETELAGLRRQIAEAQRQMAEAQAAAAGRRHSYAVVPYQGPNQTHRRPIYLECRVDAVVVQPEGIVLSSEDFEGPMGPSNPLAVALRTIREYLLRQPGYDPQRDGEPYPLLLVRPEGIEAYYAARAAMKAWGSEFGYELVGTDWKLAYLPPDSALAQVVREAVAEAREVQKRLIAAAPSRYRSSRPRPTYRVAPGRGGVVLDRGSPEEDFRPRSGFAGHRPYCPPQEEDAEPTPSGRGGSSSSAARDPFTVGHNPYAALEVPQAGGTSAGGASPGPSPASTAGSPVPTVPDMVAGRPREEKEPSEPAVGLPVPLRPGEFRDRPDLPKDPEQLKKLESLAKKRGKDWGLLESARGAVPVMRPIAVECHSDQIVILSEPDAGGGKTIIVLDRTEAAIDAFVSALWEHMQGWGIAGRNMYWRPVLKVHVAPGAERRFQELQTLLEGSGFSLEEKK